MLSQNSTPQLREYQQKAISAVMNWLHTASGRGGVIVAPTGSGKSHILAAICQRRVETNLVIILTPSREIVAQDARIMDAYGISAGVCCAGLKRRDTPSQDLYSVIIATPGSFHPEYIPAEEFGSALIIIDEAHRVNVASTAEATMFRDHIASIRSIWPETPLIGLTATPWRLGQGDIVGGDIWQDIIYRICTDDLIREGHLVPIAPYAKILYSEDDLKSAKSGGEYRLGELGKFLEEMEDDGELEDAMDEIARIMHDYHREHALIYCPTIATAEIVRDELVMRNIECEIVSQRTPPDERKRLLTDFKEGKIEALCNCAILTTGFDAPVTDLIVLLIATASRSKYYQILGRGMRPSPDKFDCLLFDGGGNVLRHGLNPDLETPPALVTCAQCGRVIPIPTTDELIQRTNAGNFLVCPDCKTRYLACRVCGNLWFEAKRENFIRCPRCHKQVFPKDDVPDAEENAFEGLGHGGQKLQLEIPYQYGTQIRTKSGKVFFAISPITLTRYISHASRPCIIVKNAFKQWAYIIITDAPERAAMGYICNGILTKNHRTHEPPTPDVIWSRCLNPAKKVIAAAGYIDGRFPRITHFLVYSANIGYESVEIRKNFIQPEIVIPPEGKTEKTQTYTIGNK